MTVTAEALDSEPQVNEHVHARRWWILATLCLSMLIIVVDNTILNVAIPSLIRDLDASNTDVQWIIDAYVLVFAGLLLTMGSLSDRFGRKGTLQIGLVVFATCSALSALANSSLHLIITRGLMGIGGAMIMPSTLSILTNVFRDPRERARAIAVWAGVSALAVAVGPISGGLLLRHFSWASVFWVNVPIAGLALVAGAFLIPKSRDPKHGRLDPFGSVLSIVGLGSLLFGIIEGPAHGWGDTVVLAAFGVAFVGIGVFIWWERTTPWPMLDVTVFSNPRFTAASGAITLTFFALFGSMFLMTQYWQFVHGYTPLETGVRVLPHATTMMITAPMSARVVERFGTKRVVTAGLTTISLSLLMLSFIHRDTPYPEVITIFCVMSFGMGMTMAPATESVMGSLPPERAGVGSAVNDTTRQVGGALGVAIIGSIVTSVFSSRIGDLAARFGLGAADTEKAKSSIGGAIAVADGLGSRAGAFVRAAEDQFVGAFSIGLRISSFVVLMTAALVWRYLPARAADHRAAETRAVKLGEPVST